MACLPRLAAVKGSEVNDDVSLAARLTREPGILKVLATPSADSQTPPQVSQHPPPGALFRDECELNVFTGSDTHQTVNESTYYIIILLLQYFLIFQIFSKYAGILPKLYKFTSISILNSEVNQLSLLRHSRQPWIPYSEHWWARDVEELCH